MRQDFEERESMEKRRCVYCGAIQYEDDMWYAGEGDVEMQCAECYGEEIGVLEKGLQ